MKELMSLGDLYLSDFIKLGYQPKNNRTELTLQYDTETQLVRLTKQADPSLMYGQYWYRSGINETMKRELKDVVDSTLNLSTPKVWLDIACNDGTLLSYVPKEVYRIGIDPADETFLAQSSKHADIVIKNFFSRAVWNKHCSVKADVVTCIAMFYDTDKPAEFLQDIHCVMSDNGILVLQLSYTPLMLEQMAFDNICLAKGELVVTSHGNRKIEDIHVGDYVLTHAGRFRKVTQRFVKKAPKDQELIRLRAYGAGHDLTCTKNHPVYVKRNGQWQFAPAEDIHVGDIVLKPTVVEAPEYVDELPMNENMARIAGYYMAEGSYNKHKDNGVAVGFSFNTDELDTHILELVTCLKEEGFSANLFNSPGTSVTVVSTYGDIAKWLYRHFGHHALHKRVPMWMMGRSASEQHAFLASYMNGDGYKYRENYLRASTVGADIAHGISLVANCLGYKCSITRCKKAPRGTILGREVNIHDLWDILVHTDPFHKQKVWMEDGHQVMRIRKTELVEYSDPFVYNLEVEEDNTFVTPAMVTHNCHEHLYYYTLTTIKKLLDDNGFKVMDCELNTVNGGSFRVYAIKRDADETTFGSQPHRDVCKMRVASLLALECYREYNLPVVWEDFTRKLVSLRNEVREFILAERAIGKSIWAYGASTKGNTLLQYFGLDSTLIDGIAERNHDKVGLRTVGTNIPIYSEQHMREVNPDYLLVLPWHFIKEFTERESEYLRGGGKFLVPCPQFCVIGSNPT